MMESNSQQRISEIVDEIVAGIPDLNASAEGITLFPGFHDHLKEEFTKVKELCTKGELQKIKDKIHELHGSVHEYLTHCHEEHSRMFRERLDKLRHFLKLPA